MFEAFLAAMETARGVKKPRAAATEAVQHISRG
jgi:hypothetical protein